MIEYLMIGLYWSGVYVGIGIALAIIEYIVRLRIGYKLFDRGDEKTLEEAMKKSFATHEYLFTRIFVWPLYALALIIEAFEEIEFRKPILNFFIKILKNKHRKKNPEKYL